MRILYTTLCLEKAGSHVVALTLASGMAKRHKCFFFNQGEQLVDIGMVQYYLEPEVTLLDMNSFPVINRMLWKINGLLVRVSGYAKFHEFCKTVALMYSIVRHRIDLVHGHEILTRHSRLTKIIRFLSVPVVITDHNGYTMLLKVGDTSFMPYANQARAIVAVSEYTARVLKEGNTSENSEAVHAFGEKILASDHKYEYESLKENRGAAPITKRLQVPITTIYNGVLRHQKKLPEPASIRQSLHISSDALVFGMIGRGTEQKGWRFALTAYQELKRRYPARRFVWLCMGEGKCIQDLKMELGEKYPDIIFLGSIDNPHYYMSVCDVGLVPSSFSEGLPLSIVEFFEHQVPVIASDLCGIPEIIAPMYTAPGGFLIEMEEDSTPRVLSLLHCMEQYVNNPILLAQHGKNALLIRDRFDMEQFIDSHEQLYTRVLANVE